MIQSVSAKQVGWLQGHRSTSVVVVILLGLVFSLALMAASAGVALAQTDAPDPLPASDLVIGDDTEELDSLSPSAETIGDDEPSLVDDDPLGDDVDAEGAANVIGDTGDDFFGDVAGDSDAFEEPLLDEEVWDGEFDFDFDNEPLQIVEEHPEPLIAPPPEQEPAASSNSWLWIVLPVVLVAALVFLWRRPHAGR